MWQFCQQNTGNLIWTPSLSEDCLVSLLYLSFILSTQQSTIYNIHVVHQVVHNLQYSCCPQSTIFMLTTQQSTLYNIHIVCPVVQQSTIYNIHVDPSHLHMLSQDRPWNHWNPVADKAVLNYLDTPFKSWDSTELYYRTEGLRPPRKVHYHPYYHQLLWGKQHRLILKFRTSSWYVYFQFGR